MLSLSLSLYFLVCAERSVCLRSALFVAAIKTLRL